MVTCLDSEIDECLNDIHVFIAERVNALLEYAMRLKNDSVYVSRKCQSRRPD